MSWESEGSVNFKGLAKSLELEEVEFLELIDLFLKTAFPELIQLQLALDKQDASVAERLAHSIKGAAGSLGFRDIYDEARKIEVAARENHLTDIHEGLRIIKGKLNLIADVFKGEDQNAKD